jgi:outer membrane lipoprotein SlyB
MLALVAMLPAQNASAQDNTMGGAIIGGGIGAIIGGAATGNAGGAIAGGIIGAAAGAALGSQMELLVRRSLLGQARRRQLLPRIAPLLRLSSPA